MEPDELQAEMEAHDEYMEDMQDLVEKMAADIRKMQRELDKLSEDPIQPEEEEAA